MEANIKQANAVFIQRYATAEEWTANNPPIYPGEIGIESNTGKIKVGSTVTRYWNELDYNSSDGGQIIDNLDTIYSDPEELPVTGVADGTQLVAKANGDPPMSIYRWFSALKAWVNIGLVKETVVYFVKKKGLATNILCFYDPNSTAFITTEQQKEISITDIDYVFRGADSLNSISNKQDGDIYVVYDLNLQRYCLYQYQASVGQWALIAALNEQTIYTNVKESKNRSAPANSLWKAKISSQSFEFVRLGWDSDLAQQIGDLTTALSELHTYAQKYIGG